ncbi:probable ribonuclease P/MRP protein subunit POP5 [Lotus japonicus]|uniref:probable ribonuclease P/MRP protein subunit POP5 n=1 Tax=Lotus japonicus TaxID=34305 RepID=UPI00258CD599|nr:probable ribonuclease P/MRP protein subunit POP5 [Lotus japonicus]
MVAFKNRYMVMEVFANPNNDQVGGDPVIITQFNVTKAIKDSILVNFGECGLASSLGSLQVKYVNPITNVCIIRTSREDYQHVWAAITMVRSIGNYPVMFNMLDLSGSLQACKKAALKCEESKFEQYKLKVGDRFSDDDTHRINSYLDRIKVLEH